MILSKPFDKGKLVDFNTERGEASFGTGESGKPQGTIHFLDKKSFSLYCKSKALILQIGCDKWDLSSDDVKLVYFHNMANRTTCFEVKSPKKSVSVEYKAWWGEIPGFEPVEPEMDEDEDFLGYVFSVWKNKPLQISLINMWGS